MTTILFYKYYKIKVNNKTVILITFIFYEIRLKKH